MTDASPGESGHTLSAAMEKLRVAESLEDLRTRVEDLIAKLDERAEGGAADSPAGPSGWGDEEGAAAPRDGGPGTARGDLDSEIGALGRKVEAAGDLLAELTDLLEAQTERLETIEGQLGDPDAAGEENLDRELIACRERLDGLEQHLRQLVVLQSESVGRAEAAAEPEASRSASRAEEIVAAVQGQLGVLAARIETLETARAGAVETPGAQASRPRAVASRTPDAAGTPPPLRSARPRLRSERASVLVVDGRKRGRGGLCLDLARGGVRTVAAATPRQLLERLRNHRIDVVLMHAALPAAEAAAACKALDHDSTYEFCRSVPRIVYGDAGGGAGESEDNPSLQDRVALWGACDYVPRTAGTEALLSALIRHTQV